MIGPESTGKTTLSEKLSQIFNEPWVPEFARSYLEKTNGTYQKGDLVEIAKGQIKIEDLEIKKANKYLFCDTDLIVIKIWSEHIYQSCDEWILSQIAVRNYDYYFLCKNDFPWENDPLRENPELGNYFFDKFKFYLTEMKKPYTELEGSVENRLKKVQNILKTLN